MGKFPEWWKNAIFYELYVDKFAGNFKGLVDHLDYLKFLGVDCVHILPFMPSPMVDDGYDVSHYCDVRSDLGTLADFGHFTARAHEAGVRTLIDLVLNHTSVKHPWFEDAKKSRESPRRDYYLWSKTGKEFPRARNPFSHAKPNNWIYNFETDDYCFASFYAEQPDLNWDNPRVFEEMTDIMDFWVKRGVDGFRLDAAAYLIKREGTDCQNLPETHAMIKKLRAHIDANYPQVILLPEVHHTLDRVKEYFGAGDEGHIVYHFSLAEKMLFALERNDPAPVWDMVAASRDIPASCAWAVFLRNHDEVSLATLTDQEARELLDFIDPQRIYVFNGKGSSVRLGTMYKGREKKIIEAFKLFLRVPESSVIYYGEEIGMENDPLAAGERDSRRAMRGKFDWEKARRDRLDPDSLLSHVVRMIAEKKKQAMVSLSTSETAQ